jgi:diguanylate cyclase (GGDEF)-like protein
MDDLHLHRVEALAELALERPELSDLLSQVTATVVSVLPAAAASLLLWDTQRQVFTVSSSTIPGQRPGHVLETVRQRGGASRAIIDDQQPLVVPDIELDPFGPSSMLLDAGLSAYLGVPLVFQGESIGVLYALDESIRDYTRPDIDFMTILARRAASAIGLTRLVEELRELARTDELTGLNNRREFMARGREEFERESRTHRPLSAIVFDIDEFKAVNDSHGHAVGDQVLTQIAHRCRGQLRAFDIVGRIGGEEFAVLLPEVDRNVAAQIAERIRAAACESGIDTNAGPVVVTITLGVAERSESTTTLAELLDRADTALYEGKAAGRDRVAVLDETGPIRHGSTSLATDRTNSPSGDGSTDR